MYYNDSLSRAVKNTCKSRKKYEEVKSFNEVDPLLKENNNLSYNEVKVQVEETAFSSSSASTTDSEITLTDGKITKINLQK